MKNILLLLILLVSGTQFGNAQTPEDVFQMTLTSPSATNPNVVRAVIRPLVNRTGQISSFQFAISIPSTATPFPTATVTSLVSGLSFTAPVISTESFGGVTYRNYTFVADGGPTVPNTPYVAGTAYPIAEVTFSGGPLGLHTIRGSSYPDGGSNFQSYFYMALGGIQTVNRPAQYYGAVVVNSTFETGYSYVALGNVALPTKFLSFYATKTDDAAKLTWTVDNEEDNQYFEVESSLDGRTFTTLQRVAALRNGRASNTYSLSDNNISRYGVKVIYYRIRQVETSGNITFSEVRQVSLNSKNLVASLFPNPVKATTKLVIDAPEAGKAIVIVRDATGKTVKQINLQLVKGINQQQLDATLFPAGDYNVTIIGANLNQTIKMTKSN